MRTRRRFPWEREYEELARDACAVIKARCRGIGKPLNWAALEKVFPAIPKNSVRQRIIRLTEAPGGETYLKRLEAKWSELWLQYRGTEWLPDDDMGSSTNFPIIKHLEFLRKHIDKNAL